MTTQLPFDVPRTAAGRSRTSYRSAALTRPEPRILQMRPTTAAWVFSGAFVVVGLGAVAFGVLPLLGLPQAGGGVLRVAIPLVAGILFVIVGAVLVTAQARNAMTFDLYRGVLRMSRPRAGIGPEIPLRDVAAVQVLVVRGTDALEMNLVLARPEGERLNVMCHAVETPLRADAQQLAEFLGVPVLDHRGLPVSLDGQATEVDVRMVRGASANLRTMKLGPAADGRMVLEATFRGRLFQMSFVGIGAMAALAGIGLAVAAALARGPNSDVSGMVLGAMVSIILGTVFALLGLTLLARPPVVFDRVSQVVRGKRLRVDGVRVEEIPMEAVGAVQICSGEVSGGEGASYRAFQINLVLRAPRGSRVALVAQAGERALREDAHRLAGFLGVPLIDHS